MNLEEQQGDNTTGVNDYALGNSGQYNQTDFVSSKHAVITCISKIKDPLFLLNLLTDQCWIQESK